MMYFTQNCTDCKHTYRLGNSPLHPEKQNIGSKASKTTVALRKAKLN